MSHFRDISLAWVSVPTAMTFEPLNLRRGAFVTHAQVSVAMVTGGVESSCFPMDISSSSGYFR